MDLAGQLCSTASCAINNAGSELNNYVKRGLQFKLGVCRGVMEHSSREELNERVSPGSELCFDPFQA